MENFFRILFILIGVAFLVPGLAGIYFLCAVIVKFFQTGQFAGTLEVQTVLAGLSTLAGFIGVNLLLRADILAPGRSLRIAKNALIVSCLLIALVSTLILRAFTLSAQGLPADPLIAAVIAIGLSVLLAPLPLYWFWKRGR